MAQIKVALSLSPAVVDDLAYITGRIGVSRSALIDGLMAEALPVMRKLLEQIPYSPTPVDIVRARGESKRIVEERLGQLQVIANDLFSQ